MIGEVGPNARGVQRMLERIGFRYSNHIDPFDGGPHYEANLKGVSLVRHFRTAIVGRGSTRLEAPDVLIAVTRNSGPNRFRALHPGAVR